MHFSPFFSDTSHFNNLVKLSSSHWLLPVCALASDGRTLLPYPSLTTIHTSSGPEQPPPLLTFSFLSALSGSQLAILGTEKGCCVNLCSRSGYKYELTVGEGQICQWQGAQKPTWENSTRNLLKGIEIQVVYEAKLGCYFGCLHKNGALFKGERLKEWSRAVVLKLLSTWTHFLE